MGRIMNRSTMIVRVLCVATAIGALSGCVGYNVYPPEVGSSGFTDPSSPPMYQIMTEALKWAVKKYPPGERTAATLTDVPVSTTEAEAAANAAGGSQAPRIAVSLFSSMKPSVYQYAVDQVGHGAVPLTPATEHLPTYMVSRVWVGGDQAKVDLFRPVTRLGTDPSGQPVYQAVTVNLRGGVKFWRVTSYRVWSIGTFPAPGPQYLPGSAPEPTPAATPETPQLKEETPAPATPEPAAGTDGTNQP